MSVPQRWKACRPPRAFRSLVPSIGNAPADRETRREMPETRLGPVPAGLDFASSAGARTSRHASRRPGTRGGPPPRSLLPGRRRYRHRVPRSAARARHSRRRLRPTQPSPSAVVKVLQVPGRYMQFVRIRKTLPKVPDTARAMPEWNIRYCAMSCPSSSGRMTLEGGYASTSCLTLLQRGQPSRPRSSRSPPASMRGQSARKSGSILRPTGRRMPSPPTS